MCTQTRVRCINVCLTAQDQDELVGVEEPLVLARPAPARPSPQVIPEEIEEPRPRARPAGRTRAPPGVPRRRPRPQSIAGNEDLEGERGSRRPSRPGSEPVVGTVERYSHKNEDGSFTFGYIAEDGSFREETRGVDCITRGKYGYIDPDGKRREFTYVSGLPCEIGEDGEQLEEDELQEFQQDPIDPSERFRTEQAVQLSDDEIPEAARPRQRVPIRPGASRPRDPAVATRRPRPRPEGGEALTSLINIAENRPALSPTPLPNRRPAARPRPQPARPNFDFEGELDDFTLRQPALTFEQRENDDAKPTPVGPNFSSELVFNPDTGTFQTELRQNIRGGSEVRISNPNAPAARRPEPTQAASRPVPPPSPVPTRTFSPTPRPTAERPAPFTVFANRPKPAPGAPIKFEPLSFPDPNTVQRPTPTPAQTPRPTSPVPSRPPTPQPSRPPTAQPPRPSTPVPARPLTPLPQRLPTPLPQRPPTPLPQRPPTPLPQRPPTPSTSALFQPFPPPQIAQRPPTPVTPVAAVRPTQTVRPAATFSIQRPQGVPAGFPPRPPPPQPVPNSRPPLTQPNVQFGFTPLRQQQQQRPVPFTAFASGPPPQLRGIPPTQFQPLQPQRPPQGLQPRPAAQQLGLLPQAPRALGVPPQLQGQQPPSRFQPFGRPPPGAPQQPFTVFNPNQLRGA